MDCDGHIRSNKNETSVEVNCYSVDRSIIE